jgi:hypothetical protein
MVLRHVTYTHNKLMCFEKQPRHEIHRVYTKYKKLYYTYILIICFFFYYPLVCSFSVKYKNVVFLDKHCKQISLHSDRLQCMLHTGLKQLSMFQNLVTWEV